MPFQVHHKCNIDGPYMEYAVINAERDGKQIQRLVCPVCREELDAVEGGVNLWELPSTDQRA